MTNLPSSVQQPRSLVLHILLLIMPPLLSCSVYHFASFWYVNSSLWTVFVPGSRNGGLHRRSSNSPLMHNNPFTAVFIPLGKQCYQKLAIPPPPSLSLFLSHSLSSPFSFLVYSNANSLRNTSEQNSSSLSSFSFILQGGMEFE